MFLNVILILGLLFCLFSILFTLYINIFRKDIKMQFDRNTKEKYLNKTMKLIEKYIKKARRNPNKNYEIRIKNYYGILKNGSRKPVFHDYLSDEDLEHINKLFEENQVQFNCYYSELSKTLIFNVRYPKFTTNHQV